MHAHSTPVAASLARVTRARPHPTDTPHRFAGLSAFDWCSQTARVDAYARTALARAPSASRHRYAALARAVSRVARAALQHAYRYDPAAVRKCVVGIDGHVLRYSGI